MKYIFILLLIVFVIAHTGAQEPIGSLDSTQKSTHTSSLRFNHQEDSFGRKALRANRYCVGFNLFMGAYLVAAPEHISKWNKKEKLNLKHIIHQYGESYSKPPVMDEDMWGINYIGHPYQGGVYFNLIRSQGANFWQSSLFCIGQSLLWEYGWEAGMEQPSIQDLITTPFVGIAVGELSHKATIALSKNGFRWYEAGLVCLLNPSYVINNKIKITRRRRP